ncbi:MAG: hypothetical protein QMB52_11600 [Propionivibrio sp.]
MPEKMPVSRPQTIAEVKATLEKLDLPVPDREGLEAIRRMEGNRFLDALANAIPLANHQPGADQTQLEYLANIVTAAHADTRAIIEEAGFQSDIALLMNVVKREGRSFREALRLAKAGESQGEVAAARSYLSDLMEQYGAVAHGDFLGLGDDLSSIAFEQSSRDSTSQRISEPKGPDKQAEPPLRRTETAPSPATPEPKQYGESVRVFAGKAALCVTENTTPSGGKHTVTFEVAQTDSEGKAQWNNKVALMLTVPEQVLVLGMLRGFLSKVELKGHGAQHDKAMTIVRQGDRFFLTMIKRGQPPRALPVPAAYAYPIITMLINQMKRNDPHLSVETLERIVKDLCVMHSWVPDREAADHV